MPIKNCAFVFLKPHANNEKSRSVVKEALQEKGLTISKEGSIAASEIEEKQLVDNHYYAIASKATLLKPSELNVPEQMFLDKFKLEWKDALEKNLVFNAKEACEHLGLDSEALNTEWAKAKKAGQLVKFGGGFYCGLIDTVEGKDPCYVMNGFFMSMRQLYVEEGASIYYYVLEWEIKNLSWEDFRANVIGPTDPANAPAESLRGMFYQNWKEYGLSAVPNVGENAIHGSASPFEGLAERMNWLSMKPNTDAFGRAVQHVIDARTLGEWIRDVQVTYGPLPITRSIFDSLEDCDSDYCLALLNAIYNQQDLKTYAQLQEENTELLRDCKDLKSLSVAVRNIVKAGSQAQRASDIYNPSGRPRPEDLYYSQKVYPPQVYATYQGPSYDPASKGKGKGKGKPHMDWHAGYGAYGRY